MNRNLALAGAVLAIVALILAVGSLKPSPAGVERVELRVEDIARQNASQALPSREAEIARKAQRYARAIELVSPDGYINADSITLAEHIGRDVILVDFWTYSCINCQRTFPYLVSWHEKYRDGGLVIIGVHTPEFDFEKEYENVVRATEKFGITYPVVQDNGYQTWRAYRNRYWPRKYLIDIDGFIVYDHIGEGAYAETELKIQELLEERKAAMGLAGEVPSGIIVPEETEEVTGILTPEVYFGYGFSRDQMGNREGWHPGEKVLYSLPEKRERDLFYLEGEWLNANDYLELTGDEGRILLDYRASSVNLVASAPEVADIGVRVDGAGAGAVTVRDPQLYRLADAAYGKHSLELRLGKGVRVYTFTFG